MPTAEARVVTERLDQIGRRDGLTVTGSPILGPAPSRTTRPAERGHGEETHMSEPSYDDEPRNGVPRWVKVAGIVLAIITLLVVVALLTTGGHRPRPHGSADPGHSRSELTRSVQLWK